MNTTLQEKVAIEEGQHDLVRGEYSPTEAREILDILIDKKINFHKLKSFSHDIRFGKRDEASDKRILELKKSKEDILEIIAQAEISGKKVRVYASLLMDIV